MDGDRKFAIFSKSMAKEGALLLSEIFDSVDEAKHILQDIKSEYPEATICKWEE